MFQVLARTGVEGLAQPELDKYTYTIKEEERAEIVEKKSRFISYAFKVTSEEEAQEKLNIIKKKYPDATHHVYAYLIRDKENFYQKYSDDREPSATAGLPVLEVLKNENMENVMIIVVRYFGGTLLGTGGLIKAYTESAKEVLLKAQILKRVYCAIYKIEVEYPIFERIKRLLEEHPILDTKFTDKVTVRLAVEDLKAQDIIDKINELTNSRFEIEQEKNIFLEI